jgi:hypothetical protein
MRRRISKKTQKFVIFKPKFLKNGQSEVLAFFLTFRGDSYASFNVFVRTPEGPENIVGDVEKKKFGAPYPKNGGPRPQILIGVL